MPNVADELAELRRRSLAKNNAAKLQNADGLSTPEQEAEAMKESSRITRSAKYSKDAKETLKAGTKAVDMEMDFKLQQRAQKKEDFEKEQEATKHLQSFNEAKLAVAGEEKKVDDVATNEVDDKTPSEPKPEATEKPQDDVTPEVPPVAKNNADLTPETVEEIPEISTEEISEVGQEAEVVTAPAPPAEPVPRVPNRAEKKARKTMERLGMKPVPGISHVSLKMRGNQGVFTISQPDVFVKNGSYCVFGEARQGGGMPGVQQEQAKAVERLATPAVADEKVVEEASEPDGAVDESGLDPKDIDLVISQAGCSRAKAVSALNENKGDLVNAIMSLTT